MRSLGRLILALLPGSNRSLLSAAVFLTATAAVTGAPGPTRLPSSLHHDLTVHLDPASMRLEAIDRFRAEGSAPLAFSLHPALRPSKVRVDGKPYPVQRTHGDDPASWRGQESMDPGRHEVWIRYSGRLPGGDDPDFRRILQGVPPRVTTDGTFLGAGTGWIPDPGPALVTYRLKVTAPPEHQVVAPGRRKTRPAKGNGAVTVFTQAEPVEGITLLGGPYKHREARAASGVPLSAFLHPEAVQRSQALLESADRALALFAKRYGPYPHPRFSVVSSPLATGFGYPGIAYLDRRILHLPFVPRVSLPHEVLHNWWGNGVMVAPASGNWAEGLTTFGADHQLRAQRSREAARSRRRQWLEDFATYHREGPAPALRDFRARVDGASRTLGYNKAAFMWLMLRDHLGPGPFREGLRNFYRRHRHRYAAWEDLRRTLEEASGRELEWFFHQWLDRPGSPRLRLDRVEPGPETVKLTLSQQTEPYRLQLPVRLVFGDGGSRTKTLKLTRKAQEFRVATDARKLLRVQVDPDYRVFRRLAPAEVPPRLAGILATVDGRVGIGLGPDRRGKEWHSAAVRLGQGLWGKAPSVGMWDPQDLNDFPAVVVVSRDRLEALWKHLGAGRDLPEWPPEADARVAVGSLSMDGPAIVLVAAEDPQALEVLGRPLPHYGSYGWLAFRAGQRLARGRWSITSSPLIWQR